MRICPLKRQEALCATEKLGINPESRMKISLKSYEEIVKIGR
jgi:hypothetical protein